MNGIALFVALATMTSPGVEYSFRTAADSQQEYTIQIPSEFLTLVAEGQEIQSDVPPQAGQVQRLCIRVGPRVERTAASERLFRQLLVSSGRYASMDRALVAAEPLAAVHWPAQGNPESTYSVRTGWQPEASGNQFFVQIDRTLLRTLASGDEIYVPVDAAAGRPARFIVRTGTSQDDLPRIAPRPATGQPLAQEPNYQRTEAPNGRRAESRSGADDSRTMWGGSQFGTGSFDPPPAGGPVFPSAPSDSFAPSNSFASRDQRPASSAGGAQPPAFASNSSSRTPTGFSPRPSETQVADARGLGTVPALGQQNLDQQRGSFLPQTDITPVPSVTSSAANSYAPPVVSQPPQFSHPPPQVTQPAVQYSQPPPHQVVQVAAVPPTTTIPVATMATTAVIPSVTTAAGVVQAPAKESWGAFALVLFALFFSIGGNLYLAWTALEFHSRYRNAMQRLRSAARNA